MKKLTLLLTLGLLISFNALATSTGHHSTPPEEKPAPRYGIKEKAKELAHKVKIKMGKNPNKAERKPERTYTPEERAEYIRQKQLNSSNLPINK